MRLAVEEHGADPAMVAILDGRLEFGLAHEDVLRLATSADVTKVSVKDIAHVMALHGFGATTVAATAWSAHRVGIEIVATGGIGGVHRDLAFDISGDIATLGRTPTTVVCSGAKSILDIRATREVLETNGVTVVGFQTDAFPAFYSPGSGLSVDIRCDSIPEVARIVRTRDEIGMQTAILVCVPVPEGAGIPADELETLIEAAHRAAEMDDISASTLTPYLLSHLAAHSNGRTLDANLALLRNNASVAAELACALSLPVES
jgi:pseudouridine-5'-phosphate glycosidase